MNPAAGVPALDPFFVNRTAELAELDVMLAQLAGGVRRHIGLLGLRRIGKTVLLDELRRRHSSRAIAYLSVDEVISTPGDFVRAFAAEILGAVRQALGRTCLLGQADADLLAAADLSDATRQAMQALLDGIHSGRSNGALLTEVMRLPSRVSEALDLPLLIMLDEFQEIVRLRRFSDTNNLLGTVRAAVDRPGKVGFIVAGSRVSALRALLTDREGPLFQRFESFELGPFAPDATLELANRIWGEDGLLHEPDAVVRLHRVTGGWPFYIRAVALRAAQLARSAEGRITPDTVDLGFLREAIGRTEDLGQHCRYLLDTALQTEGEVMRNTVDAVLRAIAANGGPLARASLARRLRAHHEQARIYRAINHLIDTDFLHEEGGVLTLLDPVFGFWLMVEPERRHPDASLGNPQALRKRLAWYEARHAQDRAEMGILFEKRVENVARQFRGQTVDGTLFGMDARIRLPRVREAGKVRIDDPSGHHSGHPDTYEIDVVAVGEEPEECWAIEAKHRQGALTEGMIRRFLECAHVVEAERGYRFDQRWIVASRGLRPDAQALAHAEGVLASGMRDLARLERLVAAPLGPSSTGAGVSAEDRAVPPAGGHAL